MEAKMTTLLEQEIKQQPEVIARLIDTQLESAGRVAEGIRDADIRFVVIAARGSSDNAGRYAQYLLGAMNGLSVGLTTPSLFTLYGRPPRLASALVIGISQSGEGPDIVGVVEEGKRQGALTLGITNNPDSPLASAADHTILLAAGEERSLAATKTYTAQLTALAMLSAVLAEDEGRINELQALSGIIRETILLAEEPALYAADRWLHAERGVTIGRGYNYATAFEIALKLKELTYLPMEPYSSADFRHGPLALVEPNFPTLVIAPHGAVFDDLNDMLKAIHEIKADTIVVSDDPAARDLGAVAFDIPGALNEWLTPVAAVIPGQVLGLRLAIARGYDPDRPRYLQKVTKTH
jgi:glucosamine--fructose-6-phosphate aminotransferase (isomerizing)